MGTTIMFKWSSETYSVEMIVQPAQAPHTLPQFQNTDSGISGTEVLRTKAAVPPIIAVQSFCGLRWGHQEGGLVNLRFIIFLNFRHVQKCAFLFRTVVCNLFMTIEGNIGKYKQ